MQSRLKDCTLGVYFTLQSLDGVSDFALVLKALPKLARDASLLLEPKQTPAHLALEMAADLLLVVGRGPAGRGQPGQHLVQGGGKALPLFCEQAVLVGHGLLEVLVLAQEGLLLGLEGLLEPADRLLQGEDVLGPGLLLDPGFVVDLGQRGGRLNQRLPQAAVLDLQPPLAVVEGTILPGQLREIAADDF